jgi:hypothetical protein
MTLSRRKFLASASLVAAGIALVKPRLSLACSKSLFLPAVALPHFPDKMHAFLWRNWNLVPLERLAAVAGATTQQLKDMANEMGLPKSVVVTSEQEQRSYLTVIRRNWHLLPRTQILELLQWSDEKLTFTLQEDDFFYIKLGSLKPDCEPVIFNTSRGGLTKNEKWLTKVIQEEFKTGFPTHREPLFQFVKDLSAFTDTKTDRSKSGFAPRFGYAYFALFGDPLLQPEVDPYPEGYLSQMAASGMDGTWMHIVLSKMTPFPWDALLSAHWQDRLTNLSKLVVKAKQYGIGIYLYLNEPRFMPLSFFEKYPQYKGVEMDGHAALCTSHPDVQQYLVDSMALITEKVPDLAGFFSITASENPTHCWSHGKGNTCPRCSKRSPAEVISELNNLYWKGIQKGLAAHPAQKGPKLIAWDWGWQDGWAEKIVPALPKSMYLMSVSEWDLPINRGGIANQVGEYSISSIGPGPRALRHWGIAKQNGLKTIAKIQAGCTWEIAAVPYIPALENVAKHAQNLRNTDVDGLMLGWTLGGYPSPNLEVVAEMGSNQHIAPKEAMEKVAIRRFGKMADAVVEAWLAYSKAFSEFPYHIGVVYNAPLQSGASNLLWASSTGYKSSMVGIAYDDLTSWRANYPVDIFVAQFHKVADGFDDALAKLKAKSKQVTLSDNQRKSFHAECGVAETVAIHYRSVALQSQFIHYRELLGSEKDQIKIQEIGAKLKQILKAEIILAKRMATLQGGDSRLGFEASNHYFYVCNDLAEKVINCRYLLDHWLPQMLKSKLDDKHE